MGRFLWALCFASLLLVSFAATARADDFSEIRVCVRPPNVPPNVGIWAYSSGTATLVLDRAGFKQQSRGHSVYSFDPSAPPENTALLPIPYNKLQCPPRVLPTKAPAAAPPPPSPAPGAQKKDEAPKPATPQPGAGDKQEAPDPLPQPIVYPKKEPPPEQHLPSDGVTTRWPTTVLPTMSLLPMAGKHLPGSEGTGKGNPTEGTKKGVAKTPFEKFAEEMAFAGAIANQQFNEETKGANGNRYGIPGGKNATGPNSPVAQAGAGTALVVMAVLSAGGFEKKLKDALKGAKPLIIKDTGKAGEKAAEAFLKDYVNKQGAKDAGEQLAHVADALNKNGAIGEYGVMKKFTEGMESRVQAHHILEEQFAKKFKLGHPDQVPSVILTEAQHKAITAKLKIATGSAKTLPELWAGYQTAYVDRPLWLKAIKSYFVQGE